MDMTNSESQLGTVHVIDDDDSFRTSILRMLTVAGLNAVGYRCAGDYLLEQLRTVNADECGCILLDISMPGPSGIDLMKVLSSRDTTPPVIFITGLDDVLTCVDVLKSGALDYVVKPVRADRVLFAVHNALRVDADRRAARSELHTIRQRFATLTCAERVVFDGIINNKLNKQLAGELGTCERTIKTRRSNMMEKLQVETIPDLVRIARLLEQSGEPCGLRRMPAWGELAQPSQDPDGSNGSATHAAATHALSCRRGTRGLTSSERDEEPSQHPFRMAAARDSAVSDALSRSRQ